MDAPSEKSRDKPMYLKDYERKRLLERGRYKINVTISNSIILAMILLTSLAEVSDSEEGGGGGGSSGGSESRLPTYSEEQEQLKESFKGAVGEMEEGEGEGEVLTLRKKSKREEVRAALIEEH